MKAMIATLLFVPMLAHAGFFTGNQLLQRMNSSEPIESSVALGFVLGIHDSFEGEVVCTGAQVTSGQLRDVVKKYLEANPAQRDLSAGALAMVALAIAFPCPDKKGNRRS
jgi:hypothetical protein